MLKRSVLATAAVLLVLPAIAAGQSYGEGFGIGGVLLPSGSPTILGTTRLGDSMGLEIGVALNLIDDDDVSSTELGVSGAIKKYWSVDSSFQPFVGGRFALLHSSLENDVGEFTVDNDETRFGFQAMLGGEYFLTRRVSLEGEVSAGVFFGSIQVRTGSRLAAYLYL